MNKITMARAKQEAKRFLDRLAEMEIVLQDDQRKETAWYGCTESAALRRASMDLSRALSSLRRSG